MSNAQPSERAHPKMTMPASEQTLLGQLAPLQLSFLTILRSCGGRLWMTALVYEMRRRGLSVATVLSELRGLSRRGLIRGPVSRDLAYELTIDGWDIGRPQ